MNRCPDLAVRTLTGTGCPGTPCGSVRHALPAPFRRPGTTISRESAGRGSIITLVNADDAQGIRLRHQHTGLVVPTAMILYPPGLGDPQPHRWRPIHRHDRRLPDATAAPRAALTLRVPEQSPALPQAMPRPALWPKHREAASAGAAPATRSARPAWPCPPVWPGRLPACAAARHPPWPGKAPARPAGRAAATPRPPEADCGHEAAAPWPCSAAELRHKPVSVPSARPSRLPGCVRTVSRFGLQRLGRRDGGDAGTAGRRTDRRGAWHLHKAAIMASMTDFTSHS